MVITVHTAESVSESSSVGKQHIPTYKHDMGGEETHEEHAVGSMLPPHHEEEQLWWSRIRENCQDGFSEFFGTMIMILFGDGVVAQVVLSNSTKGDYQSISWGWG